MNGFTDQTVAIPYTTLTAGSGDAGVPANYFKLNQPTDSNGVAWPFADLVVELFDGTNFRVLTTTEYMYSGTYLYVYPNSISSWSSVSNIQLCLWFRPLSVQQYLGTGNLALSPASIATQDDLTTRLAQIAMEMASRTLQIHPLDTGYDTFTGQNLHPSKMTIPPASQRQNAILGFDSTGTKIVLYSGVPASQSSVLPTAGAVILRDSQGRAQVVDSDGATSGWIASEAWVANKYLPFSISTPPSLNLNSCTTPGNFGWSNASTTNFPSACAAADEYALIIQSAGTNYIIQLLWDLTQGPGTVNFAWSRISTNGGTTWTTWVVQSAPPIGAVIRQGPNDASPTVIYPGTSWSNVSWEEFGCSLRVGSLTNAFATGTPANLSVAVVSGVPTVSIISGGNGYLSGGSGSVALILTGPCTTQYVGNATVTNGVITAIPAPSTPGAGYSLAQLIVYDSYFRIPDKLQQHLHYRNSGQTSSSMLGSGAGAYTFPAGAFGLDASVSTGVPGTDGINGATRLGAETTGPFVVGQKWRRIE